LAAAGKSTPPVRAALLRVAAERRTADATPALLQAAGDADESLRLAAAEAMAIIGAAECYPKLIDMVLNGAAPAEPVEKALLAVAGRMPDADARVKPVLGALPNAKPAAKVSLLRVLRGLGGADALEAVRASLKDADASVVDAAVRALADWSDQSPAADLLKLVKEAPQDVHHVLALRGFLRMARSAKGGPPEQLQMLQQVAQVATTPDAKKLLLSGLGDLAEPGALQVAGGMVGDQAVQAEARIAVTKIVGAMARANAAVAREAVDKLAATVNDKALTEQLVAAVESGNKPEIDEAIALTHDPKRSEGLKKALAKRAPQGFSLACYLDCGADSSDGAKGGPALKVGEAKAYFFPEADRAAHYRFGTVWYGGEVPFDATGLDAKKAYQIGFSWWDFDGGGRVESVWLAPGKGGEFKQVLKPTKLPDFKSAQEMPAEFTVAVPPALHADGSLRIAFRQNAGPNAVVSEIWLWEGGEASAKDVRVQDMAGPKEETKEEKAPPAADAPVAITRGKAEAGRTTKVLIVTGIDYPGHKWRETYPVVVADLNEDKRLLVDVAEDPKVLCSPEINDYAALIIHFMNWEKPDPGEKARANLKAFVEGGKGMLLTHFACGAFQDGGTPWPEFGKLAGRAWDRKLRGHDPYGKFEVRMTDVKHPITEGLKPFEVTDELYTCLGGDTPIAILAVATSKVDKKEYPIAFVLDCGKGRVFHTVLGHDAQVWKTPGPAELIRRGTAWAAGLPPVAK
ncbi:MAG: ThuA domain-containing protein, partial [Planctomycetota bacterium]|nr:ThuA domain-containing protein [Planctomycetota bacterium]